MSTIIIPPSPMSKVYGAFNNRVLPSSYLWKLVATAIAYTIWEISSFSQTNKLRSLLCLPLALKLLLNSLWVLGEGIITPSGTISIKLLGVCVHTFTNIL